MLIIVSQNRYGHLEIDPVSERQRRQIVKRIPSGFRPRGGDSLGYIQEDYNVESFLEYLPKRAARDIREGWITRVRLSDDHADAIFGAE